MSSQKVKMSLYKGWGQEELHAVDGKTNEILNSTNDVRHYSTSHFTPVNHNQPPAQYIRPLEMHLHHPMDAPPVHDFPAKPAKKNRKLPVSKASIGRAHSIGAVWEFLDEDDMYYEGPQEYPLKKRRKSAPPKRTEPGRASPQLQIPQIKEEVQNCGQKQADPQLPALPCSGAKRTNKTSGFNSKNAQLPPFRSLTVTKPVPHQEKESEDGLSRSSHVHSHIGWTTTQETVKLAQTTIDKLETFRYKSSAQVVIEEAAESPLQCNKTHSDTGMHQIDNIYKAEFVPSIDHGLAPGRKCFAGRASRDAQSVPLFNTGPVSGRAQNLNRPTVQATYGISTTLAPSEAGEISSAEREIDHKVSFPYSDNITSVAETHNQSNKQIEFSQEVSDFAEPTSSEGRLLDGLLDDLDKDQAYQQVADGYLVETSANSDEKRCQNSNGRKHLCRTVASQVERTGHVLRNDHQMMQPYKSGQNRTQPELARVYDPRPSAFVQNQQSYDDEAEAVTHDVSKDFELDDFDEGLEDSDLLDIIPEVTVPATHFYSLPTPEQVGQPPQLGKTSLGFRGPREEPPNNTHYANPALKLTVSSQVTHPSLAQQSSNLHDEFAMDSEDEEILIKVVDQIHASTKNADPERDLSDSNGLEKGQAYDHFLYTPIKPQSPILSPSNVVHGAITDKNRNFQSPEVEPRPMTEEEDWSFIRRKGADINMPQQIEESHRTAVKSSAPRKISGLTRPQSTQQIVSSMKASADDSHEYLSLKPFVRPDFPSLTPDRCPVIGVSTQSFVRVCFRIGEMFREGGRCNALNQDAIIELYAKVIFSAREPATTKQLFQLGDMFFPDKSPVVNGVLLNYKSTGLLESESKALIGVHAKMARVLGRLKRDRQTASGWLLHIITVRETDWEEIRWTKKIVDAGLVKRGNI